jgi:hypothetical protein
MKNIKVASLLAIILTTASHGFAADAPWHERWVFGYAGASGNSPVASSEKGLEGTYEFDSGWFVNGIYNVSKEKSGGTDNNALNMNTWAIGGGYSFNLTSNTKGQIGYMYQDSSVKNVETGGVRVGTYRDLNIYGNGPVVRLVHKMSPSVTADVLVARLSYNTGVTNTNSRLGMSYDFRSNFFGRIDVHSIDRADWNSTRWGIGLGYRF